MRAETDFNDPYIAGHRQDRLNRLNRSPEEHTYLHKTLDEAVAELQTHRHYLQWFWFVWLALLSVAVVYLTLR